MKMKVGDKVVILAGKDKGKVSEVIASYPKEKKVTVKGVNIVNRHKKPRKAQEKGGIVKFEASIDVSNAQVVCPKCNKATRVSAVIDEKGKHRACKKCGASLDSGKKVVKAVKAADIKELKPAAKETVKSEASKPAETSVKNTSKPQRTVSNNNSIKSATANTVKSNVRKTVSSSGK